MGAIILEGKTIRYDNWRQKNMPVDGPSYLVGRTDKKVLTMFCSGTNYRCLWTGPKVLVITKYIVGSKNYYDMRKSVCVNLSSS